MPTVVIGTAGHIDHGKTSLLRALTGIDADRLPEEQARGMTIDVGYAHMAYDDGVELDFVDVPGHDRLIGNMLVGAGEMDAALLVVAADDGPRPQTIEHLQLLDALGIAEGVAVVTKADLVDAARLDAVATAVAALLRSTSLAEAPVLVASSSSGDGVGELRVALRAVRDRVIDGLAASGRGWRGPHRLAVDRAFAPKGRGVVVTGTLRGTVEPGAWLRREPGGALVRVREVQAHGASLQRHAGGRAAFNIAGDAAREVRRGDVLTGADGWPAGVGSSDRLLVTLRRPARLGVSGADSSPRAGTRLRLHLGTAQAEVRVRPVPSIPDVAILSLDQPVATFGGDRGVLREPAGSMVVGGVTVLDLAPARGASRRRLTVDRVAALAEATRADPPSLGRVESALVDLHGGLALGRGDPDARQGPAAFALAPDVRDALGAAAMDAVAAHHRATPVSAGLPLPRARAAVLRRLRAAATVERRNADLAAAAAARVLDDLVAEGRLVRDGDALRDPAVGAGPPAELAGAMARLEALLDVPAPPSLAEAAAAAGCPGEGVGALQADGRIVRLGPDLAWSASAYRRLAAAALDRARAGPLTPAAFRDATGTSRKYVLAILEDLDRRQILQRTPEGHLPGPRAPRSVER